MRTIDACVQVLRSIARRPNGNAAIDEVCREHNISGADIAWVRNQLVTEGLVDNLTTGIVTITAKGRAALTERQ